MSKSERAIPGHLQPHDRDWGFDIDTTLRAVVSVRADVPGDAFSADALGTERAGSGVVIAGGLVLTMAYLIMEAETIWLTLADGRVVPGHGLALDFESGFGLIQPLGPLDAAPIGFADADILPLDSPVIVAAGGGRHAAIEARLLGRQEFAGYWEYLIDNALFTGPAHPFWGGAAVISADGKLVGIGSLILQQGDELGQGGEMNMVVPVSLLVPRLETLVQLGRVNRPPRPWLGIFALDTPDDQVVVGGIADGAPADRAGVRPGDRLVRLNGQAVEDLAWFWRHVWLAGDAGVVLRLTLVRDEVEREVLVQTVDRRSMLRTPKMH